MYLRSIVNIQNVYSVVHISINVKEEEFFFNETQPSTTNFIDIRVIETLVREERKKK